MTGPVGVFHSRVEWMDTDAAGIYHNSAVLRFVEGAEARLMAERGVEGYFPSAPRVRFEVDYEAPLFFGQDVTATVELVRIGNSSMNWRFEVWGEDRRGNGRRRAARGLYVTVHTVRDARGQARSEPWPEPWVAALGSRRK